MAATGRKRDSIWLYFEDIVKATERTGKRARCKACKLEMEGQVARLKQHVEKCCSTEKDDDVLLIDGDATKAVSGGCSAVCISKQKNNQVS